MGKVPWMFLNDVNDFQCNNNTVLHKKTSWLLGAAWGDFRKGSITKPAVYFQMSKSSKKNRGETNVTKVNDDQIQLFCAFGIVSIIKIWGEFLLSSSVFLRSQIKFQAISLIHKSETCIPNQGGWKARMVSAGFSGTLELSGFLNHYYRRLSTR